MAAPKRIEFFIVMSVATTRKISNDVYLKIKASGALRGLRETVFDYVYKKGPVTIAQALRDIPSKRDSSVNARFSELRKMEVIEQVGTVPDPTGGPHQISLWDLTGRHPVPLEDERREVWHVVVKSEEDASKKKTRIEYAESKAFEFADKVGDRLIEIVHFKGHVVKRESADPRD